MVKIRKNSKTVFVQKSPLKSVKIRLHNAEIPSSVEKSMYMHYDLINDTLSKLI